MKFILDGVFGFGGITAVVIMKLNALMVIYANVFMSGR
jgi:hypothetical protein